jgi:hypothetical protein
MSLHHSLAIFFPGGLYSVGVNPFHRHLVCIRRTAERIILAVSFCVERDVYLVPSDSIVVVLLLGAGPGSYFDFAGFIFHVPLFGSSAAFAAIPYANSPTKNPKIKMLSDLCRIVVSPSGWELRLFSSESVAVSSLLGIPDAGCLAVTRWPALFVFGPAPQW